MKKAFVFILAVFYLLLTSGVIINQHYCMDRLDGAEFFAAKKDICNTCGMPSNNRKCCHDEIKVVKLQDDHFASYHFFSLREMAPAVAKKIDMLMATMISIEKKQYEEYSPPLLTRQDTYLQNCVFRI